MGMALLNVLLVFISSRYYGAEGRGYYSLWVLNFALIMHFSGFIGGSALAYFSPRRSLKSILPLTYTWSLLASILMASLFLWLDKLSVSDFWHLVALGFLDSLLGNHFFIFLGKQELKKYNFWQVFSLAILCLGLFVLHFYTQDLRQAILWSFYLSKVLTLIGMYLTHPHLTSSMPSLKVRELWRFSYWIQLGGIIQFINYRFTAYFLEHNAQGDLTQLGVFSTAVSVAEGLWLVNRSIAMVHFSKVTNTESLEENIGNTLRLFRYTLLIMTFLIAGILFVPESLYVLFLGEEFRQVRLLILILSPGILLFSVSGIISHFNSGIGQNQWNVMASFFGALVAVLASLYFIPLYGIQGAAWINVVSYGINILVLLTLFSRQYQIHWGLFLPTRNDLKHLFFKIKLFRSFNQINH